MNEWDQDLVEWFQSAATDEFDEWFEQADQSEINHMFALVEAARRDRGIITVELRDDQGENISAKVRLDKHSK
jgi:hypothetical protein